MENHYKFNIIFFLFLTSFLSHALPLCAQSPSDNGSRAASHGISAVFAFGDSTLDPGNNDYVPTLFRGDHLPYGRDLPSHAASGRFSNGKLVMDFLVVDLGLKNLLPAYLDPSVTDQELLTGVSFASAGTGLDDLTATISNVLPMSTQLQYFQRASATIQRAVGPVQQRHIVNNALFAIGAGTNDLLLNFYTIPTRRAQYPSVSDYHDFLLGRLEQLLRQLHFMGARKFSVSGLPPIGCLPLQSTLGSFVPITHLLPRECVEQQNLDSQAYNAKLQGMLSRLQRQLRGMKAVYFDIYNPVMDMLRNPSKYGFEETTRGCCGTGFIEMGGVCNTLSATCPDASKFVFWDAIHPTQATYQILAKTFHDTVLPRLVN